MNLIKIPAKKVIKDLKKVPESNWIKRGEKMALDLFQQMSKRVPAYKDWLQKNKIDPQKIKTISDFKQVPTIDKKNYLQNYSPQELSWDGIFKKNNG